MRNSPTIGSNSSLPNSMPAVTRNIEVGAKQGKVQVRHSCRSAGSLAVATYESIHRPAANQLSRYLTQRPLQHRHSWEHDSGHCDTPLHACCNFNHSPPFTASESLISSHVLKITPCMLSICIAHNWGPRTLTKDHAGVHKLHVQACCAVLVVLGPQLRVAEHLVRLTQLLEALRGLRVARVLVCGTAGWVVLQTGRRRGVGSRAGWCI
jgi:hypothetical protein